MSIKGRKKGFFGPMDRRAFLKRIAALSVAAAATSAWGYEEPKHVELTYHQIPTDKLDDRVRIVQLSDLHLDEDRSRDYVPKMVSNCGADYILLTGDYTNHSPQAPMSEKRVSGYINRLHAKDGIYAVFGNWDIGLEDRLFSDTDVIPIRDDRKILKTAGGDIDLLGIEHCNERNAPALASRKAKEGYRIMLNHTPDVIDEVAEEGSTDLYLCGHTHGGQIRIPFLRLAQDGKGRFPYAGGIIPKVIAKNGARYQSGMYSIGGMDAYVNRGIGMCGMDMMPKMRILCRPEVALFDIGPSDKLPQVKDTPWYNS